MKCLVTIQKIKGVFLILHWNISYCLENSCLYFS